MICSRCGTSNASAARFCPACGGELSDSHPSARHGVTSEEEITRRQVPAQRQEVTVGDARGDALIGCAVAGKYRMIGKLGSGGMGAVYRATRLVIGDEVAIKILHSEQNDPRAGDRFRREAQAAARLKHPNAVSVHDFGITEDGLQYLVMDLVEGESLRQIIKKQGPLTPSASAEIINQVCSALDEAHQQHIIHRDIKPDNIIVRVNPTGLRVKVLDFGIAKLRDDTAGNLTQTGSILGTPHYMSPEQCLGEELDSRSDIYSVGVVLYEMLTGLVPFNSPTSAAVVVQQVTQLPPSLRALNAGVPPTVETVVLHALEKQRDARPQTAGALAAEFTSALHKPGAGVRSFEDSQFNRAPAASGSSAAATMVLTDRSSGQRSVNPGFEPSVSITSRNERSRKSPVAWIVLAAIAFLSLGSLVTWILIKNGGSNSITHQSDQPNSAAAAPGNATSPVRITATASSIRNPISIASYQAHNAVDGRLNTAWIEGIEGPGIGEWMRFDFDREIELRAMNVSPGYFKSPQIWVQNNRVAAGSLQFSDGTFHRFRFPDRMEEQKLVLGSVRTSWVKLVIEEVYFGKDPDTAISEISFDFGGGNSATLPSQSADTGSLPPSSFDSLEARIVGGQLIGVSDLAGTPAMDLQRLRNAVFARHGRVFNRADLQNYFASRPWYVPRGDYNDRDLTSIDKANLNLIMGVEKGAR